MTTVVDSQDVPLERWRH